ncbi:MAG TPA: glycosyltransferase family 2 protein [Pyrinomonadaceae bacterium]|nr:glycosyltransferase family 2 protein [Pyrinomonadaceae bacterium]
MLDQITPLILTYNEASNIGRTLECLRWAKEVVVVDSFSTDETVDIATAFSNVRVVQRVFDCHRNQWQFGLHETGIASEWVLALDADYVVNSDFIEELRNLKPRNETAGYRASFIYCISGKRLHSGIYPPVTVLYRRRSANYVQDGHTQRIALDGPVETLHSPLLHDDRKPLKRWFEAQSRYTKLEAQKLRAANPAELDLVDRMRRWPLIVPPLALFYCLVVRGGILDGWRGFYYGFQRVMAELMLSLYMIKRSN